MHIYLFYVFMYMHASKQIYNDYKKFEIIFLEK